jgi:hypothetical protein
MFDAVRAKNLSKLTLLSETQGIDDIYPAVTDGETIASSMAGFISSQNPDFHSLVSCHGRSGRAYADIRKGGSTGSFEEGVRQMEAGRSLVEATGKTYTPSASCIIHGEADDHFGNKNFEASLVEWQRDYSQAAGRNMPMLISQMCSWTSGLASNSPTPLSNVPMAQLRAARNNPGKIIMVGPKYNLPYVDGLHVSNHGQRWLGEYFGKVLKQILINKQTWRPLEVRSLSLNGSVITAEFHVPVTPLVLDTQSVTNPGNYGFEYWDNSGSTPTIQRVAIASATALTITLSTPPAPGAEKHLRYAWTGQPGAWAGPTSGPRGNLRDSDPTQSPNGYKLYNWCCHFDEVI